jgi:hypothetical protein
VVRRANLHDGEDLEEIVLGEVFLRVVRMKLDYGQHVEFKLRKAAEVRLTVQKLFTRILKMLKSTTNMTALHLALNPTTTITQETNPRRLTNTRQKLHSPANTNPIKRKIRRTLPANWKYIFLSFSSICGKPAGANFFLTQLSESTMRRPPITDKLRRKKLRSKIKP